MVVDTATGGVEEVAGEEGHRAPNEPADGEDTTRVLTVEAEYLKVPDGQVRVLSSTLRFAEPMICEAAEQWRFGHVGDVALEAVTLAAERGLT